jgi:hypothetical protein
MLHTSQFEETQASFDHMLKEELEERYSQLLQHSYGLEEKLRNIKAILQGLN